MPLITKYYLFAVITLAIVISASYSRVVYFPCYFVLERESATTTRIRPINTGAKPTRLTTRKATETERTGR